MISGQIFCKLKRWFANYTKQYQSDDAEWHRNILLKYKHTFKVVQNAELLAKGLQMDDQHIVVAKIIALLHDVYRFEQYKRYNTFQDRKSVDHADYAVKLIKEEGLLNELPAFWQECIYESIYHHNKATLPHFDDKTVRMFAQLIRDADKLDIFRITTEYYQSSEKNQVLELHLAYEDRISTNVFNSIMKSEIVKLADMETVVDFKLVQISWLYDLYLSLTKHLVAERKYIQLILETIPANVVNLPQLKTKVLADLEYASITV